MEREQLEAMTVADLQAYATEQEINLGAATKKTDIVDAILADIADRTIEPEGRDDGGPETVTTEETTTDISAELLSSSWVSAIRVGNQVFHLDQIRKLTIEELDQTGHMAIHVIYASGDAEPVRGADAEAFAAEYERATGVTLEP